MTNAKRALITGIFGQDGSYLTELLLSKGYEVFGFVRKADVVPKGLEHTYARITMIRGDMGDQESIDRAIAVSRPDEVYNFASQSSVIKFLEHPTSMSDIAALGPMRVLESLRKHTPDARFFQASTYEIFGDTDRSPQNEEVLRCPRNLYGAAKLYAHSLVDVYRKQFGMFAVAGILYNHESPRRGEGFVTKKIARGVARIKQGLQERLVLGDLDARRDFGYAPEYVDAMWRMLQQGEPEDFVIATGTAHAVRDFVEEAFLRVGLDWREHVMLDERFMRRPDTALLVGDASKARTKLLWESKMSFAQLVHGMVDAEMHTLPETDQKRVMVTS